MKKIPLLLSRILLGVVDAIPVVGAIKENIKSVGGGVGQIDYVRLVGAIATATVSIAALYLFASGKLSFEQLEELLK